MTTIGFGDLARTVPLTRQGMEARADLARLGRELTTGRHGDVAAANRGDLRRLSGIERSLALLGSSEAAATAAQGRMGAMQIALEVARTAATDAGSGLLSVSRQTASAAMGQAGGIARAALGGALSALSARMAGVHLFSGAASDQAPLPPMEAMLDRLRTDVGPQSDPAVLRSAVQDWFAPGGGMDATWPLPGGGEPAVVPLAPGETLAIDATAADPAIRRMLADLAVGVLAGEGGGLDAAGRQAALGAAGTALLADEAGLTDLRGRLGTSEGQSERALARIRSETSATELARSEAIEIDRYEVATKFQAAQVGVETLYLVTARLSNLSLSKYLG